jgi:Glycosyl transferase family 90
LKAIFAKNGWLLLQDIPLENILPACKRFVRLRTKFYRSKVFYFFFGLHFFFSFSLFSSEGLIEIGQECPQWMALQINKDLESFKKRPISLKRMNQLFDKHCVKQCLVKFTISNNKISVEHSLELYQNNNHSFIDRMNCFRDTLILLSNSVPLPDTIFFITMHDEIFKNFDLPIFAMAKEKNANFILIPDFEAIKAKYQVLENKDITAIEFPWNEKKVQLVWRGSSAQRGFDHSFYIRPDNLHMFSRVKLCQLSLQFPSVIDAKFTIFYQVQDPSLLQALQGEYLSFDKQLEYKYHILIDGNSCSFSKSGWKFFVNSVIFKPDSPDIQWYYNALVPGVHYIPVQANLDDLTEKILWAASHDAEAEAIAHNAREFANTHLTVRDNLVYLYYAILQYSQLKFVN